jgi:hypothetical protein
MGQQLAYRSSGKREEPAAEAVVIHCSDHRFQGVFREFLAEGLKLGAYGLLALPGGGHFIPLEQWLPKFAKTGLQSLSFLVKRGKPRKVILIGHDDCLFFKERVQFFFPEADLNQKQLANLRQARRAVRERFPELAVELYFADAQPDGAVQFLRIE